MSKSVLVMETPEKGCVSCLIGQNHSKSLEACISPHDCIRCTFYEYCPECFTGCPGDQGETIRKLQSNE